MNIKVTDTIDQKSYDKVLELLVEYNLSKTKQFENEINKPLEIIARNEQNEIIGGIYGRSIWGTLEIKILVVKDVARNTGVGRKLMMKAEIEARNRKCRFISLDTFSFQAPGFYEKIGFEKFATEADFPMGFEKYYYRKKL